jgi:hypothetical protein
LEGYSDAGAIGKARSKNLAAITPSPTEPNSPGGPVVYFQEGDKCGAGKVTATLLCSSQPGAPLGPANCPINKSTKYYPQNESGCPAVN